jgi:hypothetical protein
LWALSENEGILLANPKSRRFYPSYDFVEPRGA